MPRNNKFSGLPKLDELDREELDKVKPVVAPTSASRPKKSTTKESAAITSVEQLRCTLGKNSALATEILKEVNSLNSKLPAHAQVKANNLLAEFIKAYDDELNDLFAKFTSTTS